MTRMQGWNIRNVTRLWNRRLLREPSPAMRSKNLSLTHWTLKTWVSWICYRADLSTIFPPVMEEVAKDNKVHWCEPVDSLHCDNASHKKPILCRSDWGWLRRPQTWRRKGLVEVHEWDDGLVQRPEEAAQKVCLSGKTCSLVCNTAASLWASLPVSVITCVTVLFQILVQVKDVLSKLPSLVEITLKEVRTWSLVKESYMISWTFTAVVVQSSTTSQLCYFFQLTLAWA